MALPPNTPHHPYLTNGLGMFCFSSFSLAHNFCTHVGMYVLLNITHNCLTVLDLLVRRSSLKRSSGEDGKLTPLHTSKRQESQQTIPRSRLAYTHTYVASKCTCVCAPQLNAKAGDQESIKSCTRIYAYHSLLE